MRLIDKDDILGMVKAMTFDYDIYADCDTRTEKQKAEDWFDMAKTIFASLLELEHEIDAVPVVRCKDCKLAETYGGRLYCSMFEDGGGCSSTEPDDFCSYGERRDEETIHKYHERHKEVLKEMSMPVGRNVIDALRERRTDE